jgi:hypothetical protein
MIDETLKALAAVRAAEADLEAAVKKGLKKPQFQATMIPAHRIRIVD